MPTSVETHRRYLVELDGQIAILNLELNPDHGRRQEAEQVALNAIREGYIEPGGDERFHVLVTALGASEKVQLRRPLELG